MKSALIGILVVVVAILKPDGGEAAANDMAKLLDKVRVMNQTVSRMARQMMLQQLFVEERIRSEGNSGVKLTRLTRMGTKSYHSTTYNGRRVVSIHDHADHIRTVGMGELSTVLNGVEFRTRHNDYKLVTPTTVTGKNNSIAYNSVRDIEFPPVPPSVKGTVEQQIAEMREYFKAFATQNKAHRDYTKYFKPILCYIEGGWTNADENKIDESFDSDRHHLDASSWLELQEKIRFSAYTGRKDRLENHAYLPTTIHKILNGVPILSQWNFRIVCHEIKREIKLNRLKLVDDIEVRMAGKYTLKDYETSRSGRYRMAPRDEDNWKEGIYRYDFLDELMSEIPGKNGYGAKLVDDGISGSRAKDYTNPDKDLNAAYYHRWFTGDRDAMGSRFQHRGFSDDSLFVAATTQEKIAPMEAEYCTRGNCMKGKQRFTYAIPLEIIYLTPLQQWNPYKIAYKHEIDPRKDGLNGRSRDKAFPHSFKAVYSKTPLEFFEDNDDSGDSADTSNGVFWIKGSDGVPHQTVASGVRIVLSKIQGIDKRIRLRFPIVPIHQEGSIYWKRLQALEELVREPESHCNIDLNQC